VRSDWSEISTIVFLILITCNSVWKPPVRYFTFWDEFWSQCFVIRNNELWEDQSELIVVCVSTGLCNDRVLFVVVLWNMSRASLRHNSVARTSLNKRFNKQNNGFGRTFSIRYMSLLSSANSNVKLPNSGSFAITLHLGAFRCKKVLPATAINLFVFLGVVFLVPRPLHVVAVEPFRLTWSERSSRIRLVAEMDWPRRPGKKPYRNEARVN